ncbi:unnamed protein product [Phytomonas sp. Hart1]|nr:unnamed protein product [Phytomonas sp. Hart1]|eukprot:CCW71221.1 unnamed protein product [Phytomonas sp. isolate Hart1]
MTHVTADLEYFKCELCGVYLYKDIFCDHRRECKGLNSTELKKSECHILQKELDHDTQQLVTSVTSGLGFSTTDSPGMMHRCKFTTAELQKRADARIQSKVSDKYQERIDKKFAEELLNSEKRSALLSFLSDGI